MFVTSISEVVVPGIFDLLDVLADYGMCLTYLSLAQSDVDRKLYVRFKPELRLSVGVCNMYMYFGLFS